jgi:hypothetical protein
LDSQGFLSCDLSQEKVVFGGINLSRKMSENETENMNTKNVTRSFLESTVRSFLLQNPSKRLTYITGACVLSDALIVDQSSFSVSGN